MLRKLEVILVLLIGIIAVLGTWVLTSSTASADPTKRTIYVAAIEPKGSTTLDKEPFPTAKLPAGGGYGLKGPDKDGKWEVKTYHWLPSAIVVNQGDEVTLEILGVNGKEHHAVIEGYGVTFTVRRGQISLVNFKADTAGIFNIVCNVHRPAMTGQLVVLPRR